tara:strand:+ start:214 stop:1110 length:897 start_codon:yes stop_codon:yes gene_type:complete
MAKLLALIPSGYKLDKVASVLPMDGTGDFTLTRSTTGTRVNSSGGVEDMAIDMPRIDHTATGDCPVLLVEPQSTNIFLNSIFDGAVSGSPGTAPTYWDFQVSTGSIVVGTSNYSSGNKITFNISNTRIVYKDSILLDANTTYFYSAEVNVTTAIKFRELLYVSPPSGSVQYFYIDGILIAGNSVNVPAGDSVIGIKIVTSSTATYCTTYFGAGFWGVDISSNTIVFDMPQFETLGYRSSYIPTTTTTVTRTAETCTVTPPTGVNSITETIDSVDTVITTIPSTYTIPNGNINKVIMES